MSYEEYAASKNETRKHILQVAFFINEICKELLDRAIEHDMTKLDDEESQLFDEYTPKLAGSTYGSDEYNAFLEGLKPALNHHYYYNDHHPEYFLNGINDMNIIQLIEMLCDWKAATMRHKDGNIYKSIEINQKRFGYSDEIKRLLTQTVEYMKW